MIPALGYCWIVRLAVRSGHAPRWGVVHRRVLRLVPLDDTDGAPMKGVTYQEHGTQDLYAPAALCAKSRKDATVVATFLNERMAARLAAPGGHAFGFDDEGAQLVLNLRSDA